MVRAAARARHAVQIGARRGRRGRGVRHLGGVRRGDHHGVEIDAELGGDDLRHLGVEPLAHLGAAMVQRDRTVGIDMDKRACLVEEGGVERDAELDRGERDAAL